jgi:hypothetical protein
MRFAAKNAQPFLRNLDNETTLPGVETPGYFQVIHPGLPKKPDHGLTHR